MNTKPTLRDEVPNPTVSRQILHQLNMSNGRYSKRVLKTGNLSSPAGEVYGWIYAVVETVIGAITDLSIVPEADQDALGGITLAAGASMPGLFTDVVVTSGTLICFANTIIEE
jgi:hypothetical protein